jgi:cold shock CspA family protein
VAPPASFRVDGVHSREQPGGHNPAARAVPAGINQRPVTFAVAGLLFPKRDTDMTTGEISKWFVDRGFGFLSDEERPDNFRGTFVHISAIGHAPEIGDRFAYDIVPGLDGRPVAGNVRPITAAQEECSRVFG